MNGPGSHQHRGMGMQGRYRAVVAGGAPPTGPHARGGWHPHNQHPQHGQQYAASNKEYPYRQCPPPPPPPPHTRFHNGYITTECPACAHGAP